ncbi:acid protease [Piedraia hortae CBS 480.64]|uniref:Acid protease n=1 Tax=Piedraia hortae CBS 480.64 TaxID=1314780 RepID=A0A6A7C2S3_9PEZI|nr:acid protease [Piedraia hortae CBS 480.64]
MRLPTALFAAGALALPELSVSKLDHRLQKSHLTRGVLKRGFLETTVYDVETWTKAGAYYVNLTVGSPPQEQIVYISTESSGFYFEASSSNACKGEVSFVECRAGSFDPRKSSSYRVVKPSLAFNYTNYQTNITGPVARDVVGIGDLRINDVQFVLFETHETKVWAAAGTLGVGYSTLDSPDKSYTNMPELLQAGGAINSRLYSVYLDDEATTGSILFGGIDVSRYTGPLTTLNLIPQNGSDTTIKRFITTITGLSAAVGDNFTTFYSDGPSDSSAWDVNASSLPVELSLSTTASWFPATYFNNYIRPAFPYIDDFLTAPCSERNRNDSLTLTLGGAAQITVPLREFLVPVYNPGTSLPIPYQDTQEALCMFLVRPDYGLSLDAPVLGESILRSMYVVYDLDNGQVSVAQAHMNATEKKQIVTVEAGPSGVAKAANQHSYISAPQQTYSIAPPILDASSNIQISTVKSPIGTATGIAAFPANGRPSASSTVHASATSNGNSGAGTRASSAARSIRPRALLSAGGRAVEELSAC